MITENIFIHILAILFVLAISIHIKNAYVLAQKQKLSITQLNAYLAYWKSAIDEQGLLIHVNSSGTMRSLQQTLIKAKYTNDWTAVTEAKTQIHQEIEKALAEDENILGESIRKIQRLYEPYPDAPNFIRREVDSISQNILDGKAFVRDDDASSLGYFCTHTCVSLKMNAISFLGEFACIVTLILRDHKEFHSEIKSNYLSLLGKGLHILVDMEMLSGKLRSLENRTVLRLAWRNFWGRQLS